MKWIKRIFKALMAVLLLLAVGLLILWIKVNYPYESCTKVQIETHKNKLIDSILEREIRLRELYAQAHGKQFVQTKAFKEQIEKEREKFYSYCETKTAIQPKEARCNIAQGSEYRDLERLSTVGISYDFDEESLKFFNTIQTYGLTRIEDNVTKKLSDKWYGYKRIITGYYFTNPYWQCNTHPAYHGNEGDLIRQKKVDDALVDRDALILIDFIKSCSKINKIKKGTCKHLSGSFNTKTYIKKEQ